MASRNSETHWDTPGTAVSELAAPAAGAASPFGDDIEFPLPLEELGYHHPTRAERPHLPVDS
jgi:hypothetical protein